MIDKLRFIKQYIYDFLEKESIPKKCKAVTVPYVGGLGAQIIAHVCVRALVENGYKVVNDLSYYANEKKSDFHIKYGRKWELHNYGIAPIPHIHDERNKNLPKGMVFDIGDSFLKFKIAVNALSASSDTYRDMFALPKLNIILEQLHLHELSSSDLYSKSFACVHIRRGDYCEIGTHLIPYDYFVELIERIWKSTRMKIFVISDDRIPHSFRGRLLSAGYDLIFLDDPRFDAFTIHSLMRYSGLLIASNSLFSLTAGLLSDSLVVAPPNWFSSTSKYSKLIRSLHKYHII